MSLKLDRLAAKVEKLEADKKDKEARITKLEQQMQLLTDNFEQRLSDALDSVIKNGLDVEVKPEKTVEEQTADEWGGWDGTLNPSHSFER